MDYLNKQCPFNPHLCVMELCAAWGIVTYDIVRYGCILIEKRKG